MGRNERYVPPGKKRYYVTLTKENAEYVKEQFAKHALPLSEFSLMLDLFVAGIAEMLREMEKQGKEELTVGQIIDAVRRAGAV